MTQHCLQDWMGLVPITEGHLMNSGTYHWRPPDVFWVTVNLQGSWLQFTVAHDTSCFSEQIVQIHVTNQMFLEDEDVIGKHQIFSWGK